MDWMRELKRPGRPWLAYIDLAVILATVVVILVASAVSWLARSI